MPKGTGYRNENEYLSQAFTNFFDLAERRLKAVNESFANVEVPSPPETKRKGTPLPPLVTAPKPLPPFGGY